MIYQPTAAELAILTLLLIERYSKEKEREVTRFRISRASLRRLSIRSRIHDSFIAEWQDIMSLEHGWLAINNAEEILLLKQDIANNWVRIATKRCSDIISELRHGDRKSLDELMVRFLNEHEDLEYEEE